MLENDTAVLSYLKACPIGRSFPRKRYLTTEASTTLRNVLANGSIPYDHNNQGLYLCYKMGWIHVEALDSDADDLVCVFPSRIHEKYAQPSMIPTHSVC